MKFIHSLCTALIVGLVGSVFAPAATASDDWTTDVLMQKLAEVQRAELAFSETRTSAFLTEALNTSGSMLYRAPDYIEKHVLKPYKENTRISGDLIYVERENQRGHTQQSIYSLTSNQALNTAVEGFRAMFAGDLDILQRNYSIELSGSSDAWGLKLTPKTEVVQEYLKSLKLSGKQARIDQIETVEANGDVSNLVLTYRLLK